MSLEFFSSCTDWPIDVQALNDMIRGAKDISRGTFLKSIDRDQMAQIERDLGYEPAGSRRGLTMAKDWHVSYHRSTLLGCPAVYFVWSAIEFVFTDLACLHAAVGGSRMSGADYADCSYVCPKRGYVDFGTPIRKGETTDQACRRRLVDMVGQEESARCEKLRVRSVE